MFRGSDLGVDSPTAQPSTVWTQAQGFGCPDTQAFFSYPYPDGRAALRFPMLSFSVPLSLPLLQAQISPSPPGITSHSPSLYRDQRGMVALVSSGIRQVFRGWSFLQASAHQIFCFVRRGSPMGPGQAGGGYRSHRPWTPTWVSGGRH